MPRQPFFIDRNGKRLFAIHITPPSGQTIGCAIWFAPFAEEMNRSRRMAVILAEALAEHGIATLIFDPNGTGDSSGTFADATWSDWIEDTRSACEWMSETHNLSITAIGLRTGAMLALEAATQTEAIDRLVVWQPVLNGATFLNQVLRLRTAAAMAENRSGESTRDLRARLASGEVLEIAGYGIGPDMAAALETLAFATRAESSGRPIDWVEITNDGDAAPASQKALAALQSSGTEIQHHLVEGPAFWSIQETTLVPALIATTVHILTGDQP